MMPVINAPIRFTPNMFKFRFLVTRSGNRKLWPVFFRFKDSGIQVRAYGVKSESIGLILAAYEFLIFAGEIVIYQRLIGAAYSNLIRR